MGKNIYVGVETNKQPILSNSFSNYFQITRMTGGAAVAPVWEGKWQQLKIEGQYTIDVGYNYQAQWDESQNSKTIVFTCEVKSSNANRELRIFKTKTKQTSLPGSAINGVEEIGTISISQSKKTITYEVSLNSQEYLLFVFRKGTTTSNTTITCNLQFFEKVNDTIEVAKPVKKMYVGVPLTTKEGNIILTPEMIEQYFTNFSREVDNNGFCQIDVTVPQYPDDNQYDRVYTLGPAKDNLKIIILGSGASDDGGRLQIMNSSNTLLDIGLPANTADTNNYQDFNIEVDVAQGDDIDFNITAYSTSSNAMTWANFQIAFAENPPNIEAKQIAKAVKTVYIGDENNEAKIAWSKEENE